MSRFPELALALMLIPAAAAAEGTELGRPATPEEIAAWDIDVLPDGEGLAKGGMTAADGEDVFIEKCASCHGDFAEGVDRWPKLAGGWGTLTDRRPVKTVGSYWPFAATVWDYVHRAMPFGAAQSLTPDEVYGVTAYILYMNDVITDDGMVVSDKTLPLIEMPNENGFFIDPRPDTPVYDAERCMTDCKEKVEITARAAVLDVTPDEPNPAGSMSEEDRSFEVAAADPADGADPELVARGEKVFRKCAACHQIGPDAANRVGPALSGTVGTKAASVEGYEYSSALSRAAEQGLVWTEEKLHDFLEAPREVVEGTKMSFAGLADEAERAALIAYLKANGG